MKRRAFLRGMATAPLVAAPLIEIVSAQAPPQRGQAPAPAAPAAPARPRQKIKQSVMSSVWTGLNNSFEDKCKIMQRIGFKGLDLPTAQQVPIIKQYGLMPTMMTGTGTTMQNGFIRKEMHAAQEMATRAGIDMCAELGCKNLIGFAGEKRGMSPEEGADNTVAIFNRLKGYAEQKGVNICLEITNAKVVADARMDQIFNHVAWGIDVCKRVNSPNVKIVYDMYHVQVADGDIVRGFRDNFDHICHVHVAGNPGRNELDETQEVNWRFVANAIAESGYTGYVAHEYRPNTGRDVIKSLEQCFEIMNV